MKSKNKILFFIAFLFSLFIKKLYSQEIYTPVFKNALQLESNNCKKEASLEYRRFLFLQDTFFSDKISQETEENKFYACNFLASYYYKQNDFTNAFRFNNQAINIAEKNSFNDDLIFFRDINLLYDSEYRLYNNYKFMRYLITDAYSEPVTAFAFCRLIKDAVLTQEISYAKKYFDIACQRFPYYFDNNSAELFNEAVLNLVSFHPKNSAAAKALSIIPGLGQLYAGFPKDALNSFLLNGSLILVSIYSIANLNLIDFGFLEMNWIYRFYKGNLYNAAKEVHIFNYNQINQLSQPVLQILDDIENRIKNHYSLTYDKSTDN